MSDERKITPVIKMSRTNVEEYEVCPHCQKEIREKEYFHDADNYVFHRPCIIAGPIDKFEPANIVWDEKGIRLVPKTADVTTTHNVSGYFNQNIAGVDYEFEYTAILADASTRMPDTVEVEKPEEMPDDIWDQVWEGLEEMALEKAYEQKGQNRSSETNVKYVKTAKKGKKKNNPWAICTKQVGRDSDDFEKCVMGVKDKISSTVPANMVKFAKDTTNEAFYCLLAGMPYAEATKRYNLGSADWAEIHNMVEAATDMSLEDVRKRVGKKSLPMAFQSLWDAYHQPKNEEAPVQQAKASQQEKPAGGKVRWV